MFPKPVEAVAEEEKQSATEEAIADAPKSDHEDDEKENEREGESLGKSAGEMKKVPPAEVEQDPIAAAVASIMGPKGEVNIRKSPMKQQPLLMSPPRSSQPLSGNV